MEDAIELTLTLSTVFSIILSLAFKFSFTIDTGYDKHYFWAARIDQDFSRTGKFQ